MVYCSQTEEGQIDRSAQQANGVDAQVCAAYGPSLPLDAQLCRLPQLPLLCVVHHLLVAWICLLGKPVG